MSRKSDPSADSTSRTGRTGENRPMPGEQDMRVIRDRMRLFLIVILGLIVLMPQPLPFRLAGIVLALAAIAIGIRMMRQLSRLRRTGKRAPGVVTLVTGLALSVILLFLLIADAVYYPLVQDLDNCQAGAQTQTASQICEREARSRIDDLVERLSHQTRSS